MENYKAKINYLYNSGFSIETKNYFLIFDYYKDTVSKGIKSIENGAVSELNLKIPKKIIVFSSHGHFDHFNPIIFTWKEIRHDINYVLSSDIANIDKKNNNINILSPYEDLYLDDVYIKAFSSNDLGISFLVKVDNINIFHSGDLNWWNWWDEDEKFNLDMEKSFKSEIETLKKTNIDIDIAFCPVDPRLKEYYYIGGEYFIKELTPKMFIPMHFGGKYSTTTKFKEKIKTTHTNIIEIHKRGEEIIYL